MRLSTKKHNQIKTKNWNIGAQVQHYSSKKGIIKGVNTINQHISIYLVEFADYNRVWFTEEEIIYKP